MNNLTRYTIVLYRPKAKDMMELESRIKEGIRTAFGEEGISEVVINEYIEKCGAVEYSKTAGRSMVANLNKICETVQWYADLLDEDTVIQKRESVCRWENILSNLMEIMIIRRRDCFENFVKCVICLIQNGIEYSKWKIIS